MAWYYAQDGEQKGPIEEVEFQNLLRDGTIGPATWVWREGLPDWRPYGELIAPAAAQPLAEPHQPGLTVARVACSRCGQTFRTDEVVHLGGAVVCATCKPMALQSLQEGLSVAENTAEQLRRTFLKHESSVKAIPLLYFLAGSLFLFVGMYGLVSPERIAGRGLSGPIFALAVMAFGALFIGVGMGLRKLQPWSRVASAILSCIGLLNFPIGTLVNGYILYLLLSPKGQMVFSEAYRRAVLATPHIKYRMSIVVWVLLGIFLLLLLLSLIALLARA